MVPVQNLTRLLAPIFAMCALLLPGPSQAHPHVWVSTKVEIVYGTGGTVEAVRHRWTFDEAFTSFAIQGLDTDGDGKLSADELADLAKTNVESLAEWGYFTTLKTGSEPALTSAPRARRSGEGRRGLEFEAPRQARMDFADGRVTLSFELPLKTPLSGRQVFLEVYDKTFFVDFQTVRTADAITLTGAPAGCAHTVIRAKQEAPPPGKTLPGGEDDPNAYAGMGADFASRTVIACP